MCERKAVEKWVFSSLEKNPAYLCVMQIW